MSIKGTIKTESLIPKLGQIFSNFFRLEYELNNFLKEIQEIKEETE